MLLAEILGMLGLVKRHLGKWLCLLALLLLAAPALAIAADDPNANPFALITNRNVFNLKEPPPPPDPNEQPPPVQAPLAKVILTGILNVLGPPRALLEVQENEPPKPGQVHSNQPRKPILREGEREGSIEVISIDVEKSLVRIKNGNIETNLTFQEQKQTGGGAVAGVMPHVPPLTNPMQGGNPQGGADAGNRRGIIVAGGDQPNANNPANPTQLGAAQGSYGANATTSFQMPGRQIRPTQPQTQAVDPVVQWVQMKADEERARKNRIPFPPTPPVPGLDDGVPDGQQPPPQNTGPPGLPGPGGIPLPPFPGR